LFSLCTGSPGVEVNSIHESVGIINDSLI
jgi:hypothetical protein